MLLQPETFDEISVGTSPISRVMIGDRQWWPSFVDTIPAFNSDWHLPDQATSGFSWNDGAIVVYGSTSPIPLKNRYVGNIVPGQPDLHVFDFGKVPINQDYSRVLEFDVLSTVPDGMSSVLASGSDGELSIAGVGTEQRLLPGRGGHRVLSDGMDTFRVVSAEYKSGGLYYESMVGAATEELSITPITDSSLQTAYIGFDVGNPYAMLVEGAEWPWSYRDGSPYVFDWDTDWLYQANLAPPSEVGVLIRDLAAPPRPGPQIPELFTIPAFDEEGFDGP